MRHSTVRSLNAAFSTEPAGGHKIVPDETVHRVRMHPEPETAPVPKIRAVGEASRFGWRG